MHDSNPHLRNVLRPSPVEETAEDESGLPSLNDSVHLPHARPSQKPLYSIHFIMPKGEVWSFQYMHLDSKSSYSGELITLRFLSMEPVQVQIHGRNLWRVYDYIHQHRMPWVMEAVRDFAKDGQTIITRIRITPVVPGDEGTG